MQSYSFLCLPGMGKRHTLLVEETEAEAKIWYGANSEEEKIIEDLKDKR